ncbi:MAG: DNA-processing protein DprA, partial [Acidimicrobiia bacterium]|nr:DNA-processing protein DprA [Acidimicrobiia bacterium]
RGGALITAGVALDYGVPVHAVPGDIDRPTSVGTNRLIRDGAFPVLGCEDFAEVLGVIADLRRVGASRTGSGAGSVADGTDTTVER